MQSRVRIDDANQRDIGEVESLGNHLRAEQDSHFSCPKLRQGLFVAPRLLHRVAVHSQGRIVRKASFDLRFQFLCSKAGKADAVEPALRALGGGNLFIIALVTENFFPFTVMRQGQVAVRALHHEPAGRALNMRAEPPAVEEQNHLPVVPQGVFHRLGELPADGS